MWNSTFRLYGHGSFNAAKAYWPAFSYMGPRSAWVVELVKLADYEVSVREFKSQMRKSFLSCPSLSECEVGKVGIIIIPWADTHYAAATSFFFSFWHRLSDNCRKNQRIIMTKNHDIMCLFFSSGALVVVVNIISE